MASIPFLVPALLTSIPAALCLTWIYRRRRARPHRPELLHLQSLRSALLRKKANKRQRLGDGALEESRSLLQVSQERRRRKEERSGADGDMKDSDEAESTSDDEEEEELLSSDEEEGDDGEEGEEAMEEDGEGAVEIELDAVMKGLNAQLKAERLRQALRDSADEATTSDLPLDLPPPPQLSSQPPLHPLRSSQGRSKRRSPQPSLLPTPVPGKHRPIYGVLYLNVLEASTPTTSSSFCVVSHGTQVYRTHSSIKSSQPVFNQKVRLVVREREVAWPVSISLWVKRGKRRGGGIYCVGRCLCDVREMMGEGEALELPTGRSKRKAEELSDEAHAVRNYWQTLSIQPAVAASTAVSDADSLDPAAASASSQLLPRAAPLLPSISAVAVSGVIESRLHLETLFLPVPSSTVGGRMWSDICGLYDLHDEGRVDAEHVQQLLACLGGLRHEDRQLILASCKAGSLSVDGLSALLSRCEAERDREVRERKRATRRSGEDGAAPPTETNTPSSTASSSSSSSSSLSSFLIDVASSPSSVPHSDSSALTPVYLSRCPVCLLDLTPSSSLDPRDCLLHVRFCLETLQSLSPDASKAPSEFAMGGFLSEEYAVKNWASSMMSGEHYGSDKLLRYLASHAHFILVQDRKTGQLRSEKVPFLLKMLMRFFYQSVIGRTAHSSFGVQLLTRMTQMMGRKYDHESSKGHISAFVQYYGIDMAEVEKPVHAYRTFNEFFFRRLKEGARPIAGQGEDSVVVSPADCRITVFQSVSEATRIWIKGKTFSLSSLVVDTALVREWPDCSLAIARLAPDDYHRFHLPVTCTVGESRSYSGDYMSVNPLAIRSTKDVLTQNKRVLTRLLDSVVGEVLYVAVGATMVGSVIITSLEGERKDKGAEHGYFAFGGSTVLLLFRQGSVRFDDDLLYNTSKSMETLIRMGESIARVASRGSKPVLGDVGVTRATINPLSARKLEENDAVVGEERRATLEGEEDAEEVGDGERLFTVGDLTEEEVREVRGVLLTAGNI